MLPVFCAPSAPSIPLSPESKDSQSQSNKKMPDPVTVKHPGASKVRGPSVPGKSSAPVLQKLKLPPIIPIPKPNYDSRGIPSKWQFLNEQEWIVDSIGRDIAEVLEFAAKKTSTKKSPEKTLSFETKTINLESNKYSYTVNSDRLTDPLSHQFALATSIWSTSNYEPLAIKLIDAMQVESSNPASIPVDFAKKLASCDMPVLLSENERVALALTNDPLNASLHEQAALLQATIGLTDFSGGFADPRLALNRISAHLTLAKVLNRDSLSINAELAEVALECLACRDGVALKKAKLLLQNQDDPTVQSWLRAISIRASGDYRTFNEKEHSELEALLFGLRSVARSSNYNFSYIQQHYPTFPLRWLRILSLGNLEYETRHSLIARFIKEEVTDFVSDYNFVHKIKSEAKLEDFSAVKGELNKTSTRCLVSVAGKPQLAPISWDDLAARHCRQILWASLVRAQFLEKQVSSDSLATASIISSYINLADLTLWPFTLRKTHLGSIAQRNFFSRAQEVFLNHPQLVTKSNWQFVNFRAIREIKDSELVPAEKFFNPCIPFGTAFWYGDRRSLKNCTPLLADLERMRQWAPCDLALCRDYARKKYGPMPTAAQLTEAYGPLAECDETAMAEIARAAVNSPEECIALYKKLATLNPAKLFDLAELCQILGRTEEAVAYAEEGAEKCQDPIATINNTVWLMEYYLDHNSTDKAKQLIARNSKHFARNSAVQTAAVLEKNGHLLVAEKVLEASEKRYGHKEDLCAFLIKNSDKKVGFKNSRTRCLTNFYPDGLTTVKLADFKGIPQRGVLVTRTDWMEPSSPIQIDNVIVAVDGIPVEDMAQMALVTRLSKKDSGTIIYWNGKNFAETEKKHGFSKWFNLDYTNYFGPRRHLKIAGRSQQDTSLTAITPECFGANRCGILGIWYDKKRCLTRLMDGLPAQRAGLKVGDQLIAVDTVPVDGMTDRELSNRIAGLIDSSVKLTLQRDGRKFEAAMKRQYPVSEEDLSKKE